MKRLLIIRHAKSSWAIAGQDDFDRPLNSRGEHDAPAMAARLLKADIAIDQFISSTANRALTTAAHFAWAYGKHKKDILQIDELYHATPAFFAEVIGRLGKEVKTAAVFSHNPGITTFVNMLTTARVDNMPTCGIFAVKADIKEWNDFEKAEKDFWFFDYPKNQ